LVRARRGDAPREGQLDLPPTWRHLGYFLACVSEPSSPLEVMLIDTADPWDLEVESRSALGSGVVRRGTASSDRGVIPARACLVRGARATILASDSATELYLEDGGIIPSDRRLVVSEPFGDAFWVPDFVGKPFAVACDLTGWPPVFAFAREAWRDPDATPSQMKIWLPPAIEPLWREWARDHGLPDAISIRTSASPLCDSTILGICPDLTGWGVFLAGARERLQPLRGSLFRAGVSPGSLLLARTDEAR